MQPINTQVEENTKNIGDTQTTNLESKEVQKSLVQQINENKIEQQDKKKRKRKNKKKKKKQEGGKEEDGSGSEGQQDGQKQKFDASKLENVDSQDNSHFRLLGDWKTPIKIKFPNKMMKDFGANQLQQYKTPRVTSAEIKERQSNIQQHLQYLRKAAQIQRQVRRFSQRIIKPGRKLIDICQQLENYNRKLTGDIPLQAGIAFPTGCSLNNVAAHYSPNGGDNTVLKYDDVCKIDFGTHIKGRIIDCAFTVAFNPKYDKLLEAVKDATNTGVKEAGIDVRLSQLGAIIEEVMTSYEIQLDGRTYPIKVIKNLCGHSIDPYKIHAGKSVAPYKSNTNAKMEEGQLYAIETFGTTGKGYANEQGQCSHYMKDYYLPQNVKIPGRSKALYNYINQNFDTLAFCKRWLDRSDQTNYILPLRDLVQNGIINPCPPLADIPGSYVAQWQHSFILRPSCKQVLSRGEDF